MSNKALGAAVLGTVISCTALAIGVVIWRWPELIGYLAHGRGMW